METKRPVEETTAAPGLVAAGQTVAEGHVIKKPSLDPVSDAQAKTLLQHRTAGLALKEAALKGTDAELAQSWQNYQQVMGKPLDGVLSAVRGGDRKAIAGAVDAAYPPEPTYDPQPKPSETGGTTAGATAAPRNPEFKPGESLEPGKGGEQAAQSQPAAAPWPSQGSGGAVEGQGRQPQ